MPKSKIILIIGSVICGMYLLIDHLSYLVLNKVEEEQTQDFCNKDLRDFDSSFLYLLEIPAINLQKGVYPVDSKWNKLQYGIELLPESNSNTIFLASHSGTSKISYFRNLDQLQIKDQINLYTKDYIYHYHITDYLEIAKKQKFRYPKPQEPQIVLITCKKREEKQIIYIGTLSQVEANSC